MALQTAFLSLGLNYAVHYTSARLYDMVCVPHSFSEFLHSFATTASPACGYLVNIIQVTQSNYASVLTVSLGSMLINSLKPGGSPPG